MVNPDVTVKKTKDNISSFGFIEDQIPSQLIKQANPDADIVDDEDNEESYQQIQQLG